MARNNTHAKNSDRVGRAAEQIGSVSYFDTAGAAWRVYERRAPDRLPVLVFESVNAIRVVRDYPENWHTLPRAALEALSWSV